MPADESEGGLLTSSLYLPQRYHNEQAEPGCTAVSRTRRFSIQEAGCGRVDRRMGRRQDALLERSCGPQPPGQEARLRFSFWCRVPRCDTRARRDGRFPSVGPCRKRHSPRVVAKDQRASCEWSAKGCNLLGRKVRCL